LLAPDNALQSRFEVAIARPDLHEHDLAPVPCHQIDLAQNAAPVAIQDGITRCRQRSGGYRFAALTFSLRGHVSLLRCLPVDSRPCTIPLASLSYYFGSRPCQLLPYL